MTRVLIAEAAGASPGAIQEVFGNGDYEVRTMVTLQDVVRAAFRFQPNLILIDVAAPSTDVWEVCHRLRDFYEHLILVLGRSGPDQDIVRILEEGADDYVVKPISPEELRARVRAHLRHPGTWLVPGHGPYVNDVLSVELNRRRVLRRGKVVTLSPTEFELLACLVRHQGEVVLHRNLLSEALGAHYHDDLEYLKVYIRRLREKLEDDPARPTYLLTHRGLGYSFNPAS